MLAKMKGLCADLYSMFRRRESRPRTSPSDVGLADGAIARKGVVIRLALAILLARLSGS
jgi:hypothetical protein